MPYTFLYNATTKVRFLEKSDLHVAVGPVNCLVGTFCLLALEVSSSFFSYFFCIEFPHTLSVLQSNLSPLRCVLLVLSLDWAVGHLYSIDLLCDIRRTEGASNRNLGPSSTALLGTVTKRSIASS